MYDSLLVPLDGSSFSEHALPVATVIAERSGATIRLALIHTPLSIPTDELASPPMFGDWEMAYRDREREYLEAQAERIADADLDVEVEIRDGDVGRELTALADEADLGILATHGRGGLARAWLGSAADAVVRHSITPILLIRPEEDDGEAGGLELEEAAAGPAPSPFTPPRHVLAATDGAEPGMAALDQAAGLARMFGARLTILRVVAFPGGLASPYIPHTGGMDRSAVQEGLEGARNWLEEQSARFPDLEVATEVSQAFQPARGILSTAEEDGADLIAVGTRHRTALGRVVLGSTADKVVRAATVPVLVAHAG